MTKYRNRKQPVDFINVNKRDESKVCVFPDANDALRIEHGNKVNDNTIFKYEDKGNCISSNKQQHSVCKSQPSLAQTYDSGYDSSSVDLRSDLISNDGFSINSNTIKHHRQRSNKSSHLSRQTQITFAEAYRKRKGKQSLIVSCIPDFSSSELTVNSASSSISQTSECSERLREMKTRLRSLEFQYRHQKHRKKRPMPSSITLETSSNASVLTLETSNTFESDYHNYELPIQPGRYEGFSLKERIVETIWEIVGINMLIYVMYVVFTFYRATLSEAMEGGSIPLN